MIRFFKLKRDILDYEVGYQLWADDFNGHLGELPWGWEIPLEIIEKEKEWFEEILERR